MNNRKEKNLVEQFIISTKRERERGREGNGNCPVR